MSEPTPDLPKQMSEEQALMERWRRNIPPNQESAICLRDELLQRLDALTAERDRQYDENVERIAAQAKAEAERDAARAECERLRVEVRSCGISMERQAAIIAGLRARLKEMVDLQEETEAMPSEYATERVAAARDALERTQ